MAEIQKLLEPLSSLWDMCSEFTHHLPDWMDGPIIAINAEQVASDCDKWYVLHVIGQLWRHCCVTVTVTLTWACIV